MSTKRLHAAVENLEAKIERRKQVEVFYFGALLKDLSAAQLNTAFNRAWNCNEGEQMRMIRAERKLRGYPI